LKSNLFFTSQDVVPVIQRLDLIGIDFNTDFDRLYVFRWVS